MGLINTIGMLIFTQALKIADANVIMPIDFFQLIWAAAFGFVLFAEIPNRFTLHRWLHDFCQHHIYRLSGELSGTLAENAEKD